MKLRYIIIDDEEAAINLITQTVKKIAGLELITTCFNPVEAYNLIKAHKPDFIFIDINMPQLNGLEIIQEINTNKDINTLIVIVSGHRKYGVDGFDLNVVDFVTKPVKFRRIWAAIEKVRRAILLRNRQFEATTACNELITIKCTDRSIIQIPVSDIEMVQVDKKNHLNLFAGERALVFSGSLTQFHQEELPAGLFVRVNISTLIPVNKIDCFKGSMVKLKNGELVTIGRGYKKEVQHLIKGV